MHLLRAHRSHYIVHCALPWRTLSFYFSLSLSLDLVNVWKLNKAMLRRVICYYDYFLWNHLRKHTHTHTLPANRSTKFAPHTMFVCVTFGPFCVILSNKQSVNRISWLCYFKSQGNSLVKHLTMYFIKRNISTEATYTIFNVWPYFPELSHIFRLFVWFFFGFVCLLLNLCDLRGGRREKKLIMTSNNFSFFTSNIILIDWFPDVSTQTNKFFRIAIGIWIIFFSFFFLNNKNNNSFDDWNFQNDFIFHSVTVYQRQLSTLIYTFIL